MDYVLMACCMNCGEREVVLVYGLCLLHGKGYTYSLVPRLPCP